MDEFERLVAARGNEFLRLALLLTGSRHDAEDLVQTALAKTCHRFDRLNAQGPDAYAAYLRRTIYTTHVSLWRRSRRIALTTRPIADVPVYDNEPGLQPDTVAALLRLPMRQRQVIVLRFFEDLSVQQTADAMRCSTGTVKQHQSRAIATLREMQIIQPQPQSDTGGAT